MGHLMIFTDGSVDTLSKTGYGACLVVPESERDFPVKSFAPRVKLKRFDRTSSTKLELQTVLWALNDIPKTVGKAVLYTDSQNIISLMGRREKLGIQDFCSKRNTPLKNAALYREFFRMTDMLDCEFVKVQGHEKSSTKDPIHQLFSLVDRASRRALRDLRRSIIETT